MSDKHASRRDVLLQFAAFGAAAPLALNLSAIGAAAAATNPTDFKALVCVFLTGGNDSNNMLLATDADTWARYWAARVAGADPIVLMPPGTPKVPIGSTSTVSGRTVSATSNPEYWGGVLPVTPATPQAWPTGTKATTGGAPRTFALHPLMPNTQSLFSQGRLAAMANIGTLLAPLTKAQYQAGGASNPIPPRLYSHSDQQSAWQSGQVGGTSTTGWGGQIADTFAAGAGTGLDFMSITTAGATAFPPGAVVQPYRMNYSAAGGGSALKINILSQTGTYNGSSTMLAALKSTILPDTKTVANDLAADYVATVARSVATTGSFTTALTGSAAPKPGPFTNPLTGTVVDNPLADQLYAVAQTVAAHGTLKVNRQVFFVSIGSFDTHDGENERQSLLLAQVDHALGYFDSALTTLGLNSAVTSFTASDFNRTFVTNGDGTDHAWGGHHLMMGGAVKGGDIYGQYPTLGTDVTGGFQNPNAVGGALIPTTSVDQYMATMASWFGVDQAGLAKIFPNLANFSAQNLGFMKAG